MNFLEPYPSVFFREDSIDFQNPRFTRIIKSIPLNNIKEIRAGKGFYWSWSNFQTSSTHEKRCYRIDIFLQSGKQEEIILDFYLPRTQMKEWIRQFKHFCRSTYREQFPFRIEEKLW
ncbi:MAG: hypothetical protein ACFFBD_22505 [Candidatus Hodarchaeota archaeon]